MKNKRSIKIQQPFPHSNNNIVGTGIKLPKNMLMKINDWTFVNNNSKLNLVKLIINSSQEIIIKSYMEKMYIFKIDDSFIGLNINEGDKRNTNIRKYMSKSIYENSIRIFNELERFKISFRLESENYSMTISISMDPEKSSIINIMSYRYSTNNMMMTNCFDSLEKHNNDFEIFRNLSTPFFIAKKYRDIVDVINSEYTGIYADDKLICILYNILKMIIKHGLPDKEYCTYNKAEIYVLKKIIKHKCDENNYPVILLNKYITSDPDEFPYIDSKVNSKALMDFILNENYDNPLIDLSDKDMKYIRKYMSDKLKNNEYIDLKKYLYFPYGEYFRLNIDDFNIHLEVDTSYVDNDDTILINISYELNDNLCIFSNVTICDISKFNMSKIGIETFIIFKNDNIIYENINNINSIIPESISTYKFLICTAIDIITIHMILYDKPSKYRVIRSSERKEVNHSSTFNSTSKSNNNSDNDIIIKRILKSKYEVNSYIKSLQVEHREVEYTIESWPRKGFYRSDGKGGKIWIEPTMCHRHLPLSDKEIHIKL